jgi:hypothetical protein
MPGISFYIVTSDATAHMLPLTCHAYNKYWQPEGGQQFKVLGNHAPTDPLPDNFEFVQIKTENNLQKWTKYIYEYITQNESNDYFVLTLDDYIPNAPLDQDIFRSLLSYAQGRQNVGRIALSHLDLEQWDVAEHTAKYDIVKLRQDTVYRISCQTSVWNKEYFAKFFNQDWTPWQLELEGSKLAKNDGWEIVGTDRAYAFSWQEESALSGRWPGMVNVLGIRPEDVRYALGKGWLSEKDLQYGIWYECRIPFVSRFQSVSKKITRIPKFRDVGYDFHWSMIRPYVRRRTFKRLFNRYGDFYLP